MKDLSTMSFGECLKYLRKKNKQFGSREKLALATNTSKWSIASLENNSSRPTRAELNALCKIFNSPILEEKGLYLITHPDVKICFSNNTPCWKCKKSMCTVYGLIDGHPISPECFNDSMLEISRQKGAILQDRMSATTGETHLVNVCPHCGAFIGNFYLHDLWYGETETIQVEDVANFIEDEI